MTAILYLALLCSDLRLGPQSADTPYREPQLATSEKISALAFGAGGSIYVATSVDEGRSFGEPVRVADSPVLPLNRHRGPRVVLAKGSIVVTAVAGRTEAAGAHSHGLPADGDLFAWRSSDGGNTWSGGVRVNDIAAAPREGLHTLAADAHGNLFAAWLDLRGKGTALYGSWSVDGGATWSANAELYSSPDGSICQCCHPSAGFAEDGELQLMWRNAVGGSRDLYMIRAKDGHRFAKPQKVGLGTWKIEACPMDGGGLAHAQGRTITAWRRKDEIFLAEPGKAETKLGEGRDVAVAATSGARVYAAWIKEGQLELWESGHVETLADRAAFPALTALPSGGVLAAWEQDGTIVLRRVP